MIGWRRYVVVALVGVAWGALLMSAFLRRQHAQVDKYGNGRDVEEEVQRVWP